MRRELRKYVNPSAADVERVFSPAGLAARQQFIEVAQREGVGRTVLALSQGIEAISRQLAGGIAPASDTISDGVVLRRAQYSAQACGDLRMEWFTMRGVATGGVAERHPMLVLAVTLLYFTTIR